MPDLFADLIFLAEVIHRCPDLARPCPMQSFRRIEDPAARRNTLARLPLEEQQRLARYCKTCVRLYS